MDKGCAKRQKVVLSIAGSDNSGGAGVQADIKTCCALGVYASTVVTSITAQNSIRVYKAQPVDVELVGMQFDSIMETIGPDAVKIGLLPSVECVDMIANKILGYNLKNIIIDPVMIATVGDALIDGSVGWFKVFIEKLVPLATLLTPNIPEARKIVGDDTGSLSIEELGNILIEKCRCPVLLKGGHRSDNKAMDILYNCDRKYYFTSDFINSNNTHGTGCALSTAIACGLAKGEKIEDAIRQAKEFVFNAIKYAKDLNIAKNGGPMNFLYNI